MLVLKQNKVNVELLFIKVHITMFGCMFNKNSILISLYGASK